MQRSNEPLSFHSFSLKTTFSAHYILAALRLISRQKRPLLAQRLHLLEALSMNEVVVCVDEMNKHPIHPGSSGWIGERSREEMSRNETEIRFALRLLGEWD